MPVWALNAISKPKCTCNSIFGSLRQRAGDLSQVTKINPVSEKQQANEPTLLLSSNWTLYLKYTKASWFEADVWLLLLPLSHHPTFAVILGHQEQLKPHGAKDVGQCHGCFALAYAKPNNTQTHPTLILQLQGRSLLLRQESQSHCIPSQRPRTL